MEIELPADRPIDSRGDAPPDAPSARLYPTLAPRPWIAAGWLSISVAVGIMSASWEFSIPLVISIPIAVGFAWVVFVVFAPWRWIREVIGEREALRKLRWQLGATDLADRRRALSSDLLQRQDDLGELCRAIHDCLARAIAAQAEARMLQRTMRDAVERRSRNAAARQERESTSDALTGVGNRRALVDALNAIQIEQASISEQTARRLTAILIDVDHLEQINDTHGRETGDECLQFLADLLRSAARSDDLVVRFGDDEFLMIQRDNSLDDAQALAERLRILFSQMPWTHSDSARPTISIGIAESDLGRNGAMESVIQSADHALQEARKGGRDRMVVRPLTEIGGGNGQATAPPLNRHINPAQSGVGQPDLVAGPSTSRS